MTREVREARGPRRILEVGPGEGPMTRQIVRALHEGDVFDVVEINPVFAEKVERTILAPARGRIPGARLRMHCSPIQTAPLEGNYDFVVSSLPMNNFEPQLVRDILTRMRSLLAPHGQLHFFEYACVRQLAKVFRPSLDRDRLKGIAEILREFDREPGARRSLCLMNFPPAMKRSLIPTAIATAASSQN